MAPRLFGAADVDRGMWSLGDYGRMSSKKTGYLLGAIAGAGIMAAAVAGAGMQLPAAHAERRRRRLIKASPTPIFAPPPGAPMSFADIFDQVSPAVVSINVTSPADPRSALCASPASKAALRSSCPRSAGGGEDDEDGDERPHRAATPAAPAAPAVLRLGLLHLAGRLHRHQQPRRRERRRPSRSCSRTSASSTPRSSAATRAPTSRCSRSRGEPLPLCELRERRPSRASATGSSRSATRSAWAARPRPASSRPTAATIGDDLRRLHPDRRAPSTGATRAARPSTSTAGSSG